MLIPVAVAALILLGVLLAADPQGADDSQADDGLADSADPRPVDLVERSWALPLFAIPLRIQRERALDHPSRRRIQSLVEAHPGIHLRGLVRISALALGVVRYHVRVLEGTGHLSSVIVGGQRCFFPSGVEPVLDVPQITRRRLQVLECVEARPGVGVREVARALGLSPQTVGYHVRLLRESGLVGAESAGRTLRLHRAPATVMAQS